MPDAVDRAVRMLLEPRLLVCVAGAYPDGSSHALTVSAAKEVIRATRTNSCVIQLARHGEDPQQGIPVRDLLASFKTPERVVPMLNTSRATSGERALSMIDDGLPLFEPDMRALFPATPLVKLEVIDESLRVGNAEVLRCLAEMAPALRHRTLPILEPRVEDVETAIEAGCPAIRIVAGEIGRQNAVLAPDAVAACIAAAGPVPVILEGGIDTPELVEVTP